MKSSQLSVELDALRMQLLSSMSANGLSDQSAKIEDLQTRLGETEISRIRLLQELNDVKTKKDQDVRELTVMHEKEITRLETNYNSVKEEHDPCEPRASRLLQQAEADKISLRGQVEDAQQMVGQREKQLESLRTQLAAHSRTVAGLREELIAARTELQALKDEASKLPDRVRTLYNQRFPDGFDILPTASKGAQCGFHAVIESMKAMNAADPNKQQPVPTAAELQAAFQSPQVQQTVLDWSKALGSSDTQANAALRRKGDFSIEEISLALDHWATTRNNLKLQIGYLRKNGFCKGKLQADGLWEEFLEQGYSSPQLVWCRHQEDPECTVIWIHHNGLGEDDAAAHYSGMRNHLPASQEQQQ